MFCDCFSRFEVYWTQTIRQTNDSNRTDSADRLGSKRMLKSPKKYQKFKIDLIQTSRSDINGTFTILFVQVTNRNVKLSKEETRKDKKETCLICSRTIILQCKQNIKRLLNKKYFIIPPLVSFILSLKPPPSPLQCRTSLNITPAPSLRH